MADTENTVAPGGAEEAVPSPIQPDLEAIRDERVIPVVKGMLADFAESLPTGDDTKNSDFTTALIKVLQRTLDADLNLTTENPYIFQLGLGVLSAFNDVVGECEKAPAEDERYGRVASRMMALLVQADVPMGTNVTPVQQKEALQSIKPQLQEIFLAENLTSLEISYILEGILRSFKTLEELFSGNVQRSVNRMEGKILGLEDITDLTMSKLDETLQRDISEFRDAKVSRETAVE